jgi:hypothetical protein
VRSSALRPWCSDWLSGFIASWTILLEQKSRRSELALYVLPRTIDSLLQTMQHRKMLANIPHGEKGLFCLGMGALMYFREYSPDSMSPLLKRVLNFFVPTFKSLPKDHPTLPTGSIPNVKVDAPPHLIRADSDGLSTASINGTIPLPSAGISFSREQSFSVGQGPSTLDSSSSYNLLARDLSPTASSLDGPDMSPSPDGSIASPTAVATTPAEAAAVVIACEPERGPGFVEEKVDVIEQHIAEEQVATVSQVNGKKNGRRGKKGAK